MTMTTDKPQDDMLEALFGAARARAPEPTEAFMARLAADADREVAGNARKPAAADAAAPGLGLARLLGALLPVSGLAATAAAGVWIGVMLPDSDLAEDWYSGSGEGLELTSFLPGAAFDGLEAQADPQ